MKHRVVAVAIAGFVCLFSTSATYTLYSSERGTAVHSRERPVNFAANAGNPDFSIAITPNDATVVQGGNTSYTVSVTPSNGFSGMVSLSAGGFGSGATGSFSPPGISVSGSSTLTVMTTGTAQTGTFTLTITGSTGSLLHTTIATLTVTAAGGTPTSTP